MAADTAIWQGNVISQYAKKIYRLSDGRLFGGTGQSAVVRACVAWLEGGEKPEAEVEGNFGGLILAPDGVTHIDHKFRKYRSAVEFQMDGGHIELLLGAHAMGASPEPPVRIAIQYGERAGGEVQVERLADGLA